MTKKEYKKSLNNIKKNIQVFLKKKNKKSNNMVIKDTNIYWKMKNKSWLNPLNLDYFRPV